MKLKKQVGMLLVIILTFSVCLLTACDGLPLGATTALSTPVNLVISKTLVTWDSVENADSYIVKVGSSENPCSNNQYELAQLNLIDGQSYNIIVKAKGSGYKDSDYSIAIQYTPTTNNIDHSQDKLNYDMSNVLFENKTVIYNGQPHSIIADNLPQGVSATYEGNGCVNVGVYTITAKFLGNLETHNPIADRTAKLTINDSKLNVPQNVYIKYDTIFWDEVENADSYIVYVDEYSTETFAPYCSLADVKNKANEKIVNARNCNIRISAKSSLANGYENSNMSNIVSYLYVPKTENQSIAAYINLGIGKGYNFIKYGDLETSGKNDHSSKNSVVDISKLFTVSTPSIRPSPSGTAYSLSATSISDFISKTGVETTYNSETGSSLIGKVTSSFSFGTNVDYSKYDYSSSFYFCSDITDKDYVFNDVGGKANIVGFTGLNAIVQCLSSVFLQEVKRDTSTTKNMTTEQLAKYILDNYGTHVILGVTTGGRYRADYTLVTNKKDIAVKANMQLNYGVGGDSILPIQTDWNLGINLNQYINNKTENTEAIFNSYYIGGNGGLTTNFNGLDAAFQQWSTTVKGSDVKAISLTNDGTVTIASILDYLDSDLAIKFRAAASGMSLEVYNSLISKYPNLDAGDGTSARPYLIATPDEFYTLLALGGETTYYKLLADIDLKYLAKQVEVFQGILDGNNKTVSNFLYPMLTTKFDKDQYVAPIAINKGTIKNLIIANTVVRGDSQHNGAWVYVGGLVGWNQDEGRIQDVKVMDSIIEVHRAGSAIGGIAGINNGRIENSSVEQARFYGNGDCGGISGRNAGVNAYIGNVNFIGKKINGDIKNNENNVSFHYFNEKNGDNGGAKSWGGIVGWNTDKAQLQNVTVEYGLFYCTGSSDGKARMGYLVGHNEATIIGTKSFLNCGEYRTFTQNLDYYFKVRNGMVGRDSGSII